MMLAAVITDTVADPTDSRSSDAITQPSTSGDSCEAAHRLRDRGVDVRDDEHPAEAAARADDEQDAGDRAAAIPRRTSAAGRDSNPHARPNVTSARSVATIIATSGLPTNAMARRSGPSGMTICAADASSISSTGMSIVTSVTPSAGVRARAARRW